MDGPHVPERFEVLETMFENEREVALRARDTKLEREVVLKMPGSGMQGAIRHKRGMQAARALCRVIAYEMGIRSRMIDLRPR